MFPPRTSALPVIPFILRTCGTLISFCTLIVFVAGFTFAQTPLPYLNAGPNSAFAQFDYGQAYAAEQIWHVAARDQAGQLSDSESVSMLDLEAPGKAVAAFNQGTSLLREQRPKDAAKYFQKAISAYPDFVSAHTALAFAYLDQRDKRARDEFEAAAKLDDSVPGPFMNLGMLALSNNDFATAYSELEKAASISPNDATILSALAFAQNGSQRYAECLETVQKVHRLQHRRMANVHYIAAAAAMALHEEQKARDELDTFIREDPANPLSPIARGKLQALAHPRGNDAAMPERDRDEPVNSEGNASFRIITLPDKDRLEAELRGLDEDHDPNSCNGCSPQPDVPPAAAQELRQGDWTNVGNVGNRPDLFTIHEFVDETALFFSVSEHGHAVDDLSLSDVRIEDNDKPPAKILDFIPQSKLPLRLGLLIDRSGSVERRFSFEKRAAEKFIQHVLNHESDLAFVAGFNNDVEVTQDFTNDPQKLTGGLEKLTNDGETSIFDSVNFACWKLAAYPDQQRVAKVLVVLTDGEDNASHRSLKQALETAEASGVTIYTVSTSERADSRTDAGKILQAMAEHSGGEAIFPGSLGSLDRYLLKLPNVIRNRYLIAYRAANFTPNGQYRKVHVKAEKGGKDLHVNVRRGYYARLAMNE